MSSFDEEKATSAPKETARSAATEGEAPTQSSTKVWALLFGLVFLAGVAVAITVPIVHYGKDSPKAVVTPEPPLETEAPTSSPAEERTPVPPPFTAFNVSLNNFDSAVLLGYETEEEFSADLGDALRLLIDRVLARNLGYHGYEMVGVGLPSESFAFADVAVPCPGLSPDLDQGSGNPEEGSGNPERGSVGDDQNDYGTNNQEDGVEEGDVVVASAEFSKWARRYQLFVSNPRPPLKLNVALISMQCSLRTVTTFLSLIPPRGCSLWTSNYHPSMGQNPNPNHLPSFLIQNYPPKSRNSFVIQNYPARIHRNAAVLPSGTTQTEHPFDPCCFTAQSFSSLRMATALTFGTTRPTSLIPTWEHAS
jgi:hypothetical protein